MTVEPQTVPLKSDAHGTLRVADTRVTLETVVTVFQNGASAEEIAAHYPVSLADAYSVIAYYLRHREEVEEYMAASAAEAERVRAEIEGRPGYAEFRERLLARARASGLR